VKIQKHHRTVFKSHARRRTPVPKDVRSEETSAMTMIEVCGFAAISGELWFQTRHNWQTAVQQSSPAEARQPIDTSVPAVQEISLRQSVIKTRFLWDSGISCLLCTPNASVATERAFLPQTDPLFVVRPQKRSSKPSGQPVFGFKVLFARYIRQQNLSLVHFSAFQIIPDTTNFKSTNRRRSTTFCRVPS
jgi:hypothetical protein